jgi:nucleoside phosphorylase
MPRAVILTALSIEYLAVRAHLTDLQEEIHPQGTIYERGKFVANGQIWEIGIAEVGAGTAGSAVEAERAITHFKPNTILFVGIAGGIKDVDIGDVVAATEVYGYESGKSGDQFFTRPKVGKSANTLVQRAKAEARKDDWRQRLPPNRAAQPRVLVAPIAAGDKVISSKQSETFQLLKTSYNDAIAVEMEGFGFLSAAFAHPDIQAIVIRGISDLIDGKNANDPNEGAEEKRQERASRHASAFAFEILAKLIGNITLQHNLQTNSLIQTLTRLQEEYTHTSNLIRQFSGNIARLEKALCDASDEDKKISLESSINEKKTRRKDYEQKLISLEESIRSIEKN